MNLELIKTIERGLPRQSFTIVEVASATGLSVPFVRKELSAGHITGKKFGRRILILKEELTRYLEAGSTGTGGNGLEADKETIRESYT